MKSLFRKLPWVAVLVATLVIGLPSVSFSKSPQEVSKIADRSIGRVITKSGTGTGFVIGTVPGSKDLYFVTNQHVAEMASTFIIGFGLKDRVAIFTAKVVVKSKGHDMAVLRLKVDGSQNYTPPALALASREIEKGEQAYAIGYPGVADISVTDRFSPDGFETTLTVGRVSRVTNGNWGGDTPIEIVQHTASISGGNSGGPLLDICGRVIGVNTAFAVKGNDTYLASSSNSLGNYLRDAGIKFTSYSVPCRPNKGAASPSTGTQTDTSDTGSTSGGGALPVWGIVLIAVAGVGIAAFGVFTMTSGTRTSGARENLEDGPGSHQIDGKNSIALRLAVSLPDGNRTSLAITKFMLKSGTVLGRAGSADLAINGGKVSRQHAKIFQDGRKLMVMDMGSTNGTKLNGKALRPHQATQINSSSQLELGRVKIKLSRG